MNVVRERSVAARSRVVRRGRSEGAGIDALGVGGHAGGNVGSGDEPDADGVLGELANPYSSSVRVEALSVAVGAGVEDCAAGVGRGVAVSRSDRTSQLRGFGRKFAALNRVDGVLPLGLKVHALEDVDLSTDRPVGRRRPESGPLRAADRHVDSVEDPDGTDVVGALSRDLDRVSLLVVDDLVGRDLRRTKRWSARVLRLGAEGRAETHLDDGMSRVVDVGQSRRGRAVDEDDVLQPKKKTHNVGKKDSSVARRPPLSQSRLKPIRRLLTPEVVLS